VEIQYSSSDYPDFLQTIADAVGGRVSNNFLQVPHKYGKGYGWAESLPNGVSVLVSDMLLNVDLYMNREASARQFYVLQFNESSSESDEVNNRNQQLPPNQFDMNQQIVLLTNSFMSSKFFVPAGVQVKSIKIIFERSHLLDFISNDVFDELMSNYFSELVKNRTVEPIDAEYRAMIDELLLEKIEHPLRSVYIANRVMLLLERFVIKFMNKMQSKPEIQKLSDGEITRLMKVEALLVKDYSTPPPTIEKLSKLSAMSPTKLKRDFKSMYGLPIYEYFQKNRMMHAKKLLTGSNISIKEAGMMVGYTNLGHFAAAFRKEFGMLPSEMMESPDMLIDFEAKAV